MDSGHENATDVVCVGETMALLVPEPTEHAEPAATFRRDIGGAEANVAIHLARAGRRAAWHGVLGEDAFGGYIRRRLAAEGVECGIRTDAGRPTGLYLKELGPDGTRVRYYRNGSAGSALNHTDAGAVWRREPRLVHTTGITAVLSDSARELVDELLSGRRDGVLRSFDVNYRPALHGAHNADLLRALARRADVVFCGLDEARALWGTTTVDDVRALLAGPGVVVVKDGPRGATAFGEGRAWRQPAPDVEVVEPVGAGDAFAAGVLDRMLDRAPLAECLVEGARRAATALRVLGDIPPRGPHDSPARYGHGCGALDHSR